MAMMVKRQTKILIIRKETVRSIKSSGSVALHFGIEASVSRDMVYKVNLVSGASTSRDALVIEGLGTTRTSSGSYI